jgi:hypothetical protein
MRLVVISIVALVVSARARADNPVVLPSGYPASFPLHVVNGSGSDEVMQFDGSSGYVGTTSGQLLMFPDQDQNTGAWDYGHWYMQDFNASPFATPSFAWDGTGTLTLDEAAQTVTVVPVASGGAPTTQPNKAEEESAQSLQSIKFLLANMLGAAFFVVMRWSMQRRETWN